MEMNVNIEQILNELNSFQEEIKNIEVDVSILKKKPSEIKKINNVEMYNQEMTEYKILYQIYINPLIEMANRISRQLFNEKAQLPNMNDYSIRGAMFTIRNYLMSKGCNLSTITSIIPSNTDDVNILYTAAINGFSLACSEHQSLINENRVTRARKFLETKGIFDDEDVPNKTK